MVGTGSICWEKRVTLEIKPSPIAKSFNIFPSSSLKYDDKSDVLKEFNGSKKVPSSLVRVEIICESSVVKYTIASLGDLPLGKINFPLIGFCSNGISSITAAVVVSNGFELFKYVS